MPHYDCQGNSIAGSHHGAVQPVNRIVDAEIDEPEAIEKPDAPESPLSPVLPPPGGESGGAHPAFAPGKGSEEGAGQGAEKRWVADDLDAPDGDMSNEGSGTESDAKADEPEEKTSPDGNGGRIDVIADICHLPIGEIRRQAKELGIKFAVTTMKVEIAKMLAVAKGYEVTDGESSGRE
jgi:hypothetical protein